VFGLPTNAALRADPVIVTAAGAAHLCRYPLRREELALPALCRSADRGQHAGSGYPLCRHIADRGLGRAHLRHALLRARAGREPDQAAQRRRRMIRGIIPKPSPAGQ
jgi:hypothetical protein